MPYNINNPPRLIKDLPITAKMIWINVFNDTFKRTNSEHKARQAAWAAVKNGFEKGNDGLWHRKLKK